MSLQDLYRNIPNFSRAEPSIMMIFDSGTNSLRPLMTSDFGISGDAQLVTLQSQGSTGTTFNGDGLSFLAVAQSGLPTPKSEGSLTLPLFDLNGRLVLKGYNFATDSINVTEVAPFQAQVLSSQLFNAATDTGVSSVVNVENFSKISTQLVITDTATVIIETSNDNVNWHPEASGSASDILDFEGARGYIRGVISSVSAGNVTLNLKAKV